ncbi:MAG TPA: M48 family metallopeptidase [Anaerolineales bacterium]|nr:M48 family metallopeptidase [Anaerolineales bacterium]
MGLAASVTLDVEKQKKAKEYARTRRRLFVVDLGIGGVYALAWLMLGWSEALKQALLVYTTNQWLLVAGFGIVFGGIYYLINLPLGYYAGYVLPHRYDLSNQTFPGWALDQVKGVLVGGALGLLVLEVIYAVLRAAPETWWLWAGLILLLLNVVLANLAPVLLFPIFYKFKPLDEEHADLADRLIRLAERAGTRVRGVYQFDMSRRTKAANAALTGLGNTRRILLGDTLINEFTADEIETVLAHELGHHVHRDLPVGLLVESAITLGGLYLASLGLNWGVAVFGFESPADIAALPLFALVLGIYGLVTMPLSNAYSRWRERRADAYALEVTGKGEAYASALTRLANQNLADAEPEEWVEMLLYSHPALSKRIANAQGYSLGHG